MNKEEIKAMCDKIRGKRNEKRMSQREMASKLGISMRAYNFKENYKCYFTVEELITMTKIFGCTMNDFF